MSRHTRRHRQSNSQAAEVSRSASPRYGWVISLLMLLGIAAAAAGLVLYWRSATTSQTATPGGQVAGSGLVFDETAYDVGRIPLDTTVERTYTYRNVGTQTVTLTERPTVDVIEGC